MTVVDHAFCSSKEENSTEELVFIPTFSFSVIVFFVVAVICVTAQRGNTQGQTGRAGGGSGGSGSSGGQANNGLMGMVFDILTAVLPDAIVDLLRTVLHEVVTLVDNILPGNLSLGNLLGVS